MFEQFKYMENPMLGREYTPSKWDGLPTYKQITRLRMTAGGGMGGACWYEYVDRLAEIPSNEMIEVKRYDGKWIRINTSYVVYSEDFTLATATLDIREWARCAMENIETKKYYVLVDDNKKLMLIG